MIKLTKIKKIKKDLYGENIGYYYENYYTTGYRECSNHITVYKDDYYDPKFYSNNSHWWYTFNNNFSGYNKYDNSKDDFLLIPNKEVLKRFIFFRGLKSRRIRLAKRINITNINIGFANLLNNPDNYICKISMLSDESLLEYVQTKEANMKYKLLLMEENIARTYLKIRSNKNKLVNTEEDFINNFDRIGLGVHVPIELVNDIPLVMLFSNFGTKCAKLKINKNFLNKEKLIKLLLKI